MPGAFVDELNSIDNRLVEIVELENREEFHKLLRTMLDLVREKGAALPVEELVESDLVLPEPDITLEEAEELFVGEGLISG